MIHYVGTFQSDMGGTFGPLLSLMISNTSLAKHCEDSFINASSLDASYLHQAT